MQPVFAPPKGLLLKGKQTLLPANCISFRSHRRPALDAHVQHLITAARCMSAASFERALQPCEGKYRNLIMSRTRCSPRLELLRVPVLRSFTSHDTTAPTTTRARAQSTPRTPGPRRSFVSYVIVSVIVCPKRNLQPTRAPVDTYRTTRRPTGRSNPAKLTVRNPQFPTSSPRAPPGSNLSTLGY